MQYFREELISTILHTRSEIGSSMFIQHIFIVSIYLNIIIVLAQFHDRFHPDVPKNRRILEHVSSGKCLTISQDFKLYLDSCNFDLESPSIAGVFQIIKSNRGGHLFRWSTATQRISNGVAGCLRMKNKARVTPDPDRDDDRVGALELEALLGPSCDTRDPSLNWEFREIDDEKYLLRKFPTGPCITSTGQNIGGEFKTVPCNAEDPKQAWRVCDSLTVGKCEVVETIDNIFL